MRLAMIAIVSALVASTMGADASPIVRFNMTTGGCRNDPMFGGTAFVCSANGLSAGESIHGWISFNSFNGQFFPGIGTYMTTPDVSDCLVYGGTFSIRCS